MFGLEPIGFSLLSSCFFSFSFSHLLSFLFSISFLLLEGNIAKNKPHFAVSVLIVIAGEIRGESWPELYFGPGGDQILELSRLSCGV